MAQDRQGEMLAVLRADLHNTAGKTFDRHFDKADFIAGATVDVEDRARQYREQGYSPSEAAAMACSRQTKAHKLHVIDSALGAAHRAKVKGRNNRARIPG